MTLVGLLYMSLQLARRSAVRPAADLGLAAGLDFLRAELTRQRDFHRGSWFWSRFVLFVPGPLVFAVGSARVFPTLATPIALVAGVYIAIALWAIPLNRRVARGYQRGRLTPVRTCVAAVPGPFVGRAFRSDGARRP